MRKILSGRPLRTATIVAALVALAACKAMTHAWPTVPMTPEQETMVIEAVKYELKDPDSAQFRNLFSVEAMSGEQAICGEYNARNSFGGYVGFKKFAARIRGGKVDLLFGPADLLHHSCGPKIYAL